MKVSAIIPAAGHGNRFGEAKQFKLLAGTPLFIHSIKTFLNSSKIHEIVLVVPEDNKDSIHKAIMSISGDKKITVTPGRERRQASVTYEVQVSDTIKKKNILYVPDFLINAGGIISVYHEQINDLDPKKVMEMTESIYGKVEQVLSYAEENSLSTHSAAINLAQQRITQNSKK